MSIKLSLQYQYHQKFFEMIQKLIKENEKEVQQYDPYKNPPDLKMAQIHQKASMVGAVDPNTRPQLCICCDHVTNKQPLPLCFKDQDLLNLGIGYPLYYKISKYFILILLGIFFVSGSAIYFMMTLQCQIETTCLTIFNIPIINISIMDQHNQSNTQMVNTITSVVIFGFVLYLKTIINDDIRALIAKKNCPSLYTVMLQNVPSLSNEELQAWTKDRFGQKPAAMNWAYQIEQLASAHKQKQRLSIEANKIKIKMRLCGETRVNVNEQILNEIKRDEKNASDLSSQLQKIQIKIKFCDEIIEIYNNEQKECEKVGTVFVSFEKTEIVNRVIDQYECSYVNSFFKSMFSWIKKSRLLLNQQVIIVNKAPAPKQIIWQNLRFSYFRSLIFQVLFIAVMVSMLIGVLRMIVFFMNWALEYRIEGETKGSFSLMLKGLLISLLVIIINCVTRLVIQIFTFAKKYYSYTKYQGSFCLYYSIFYILNSCCIVYIVHGQNLNDTKQLLLTDIHLVMLANAFSQPLFKLFDPVMWFRVFRRCYISNLKSQDNPYTQQYMNKAWQGHQISNADNYQYITRVLFITTWFATVAPVGVLFSLVGLVLDYWISKWLLVRYYKIPENISQDIAKPTLMSLQLLPLIYIMGILQFNYKISTSERLVDFLLQSLHYGVTTVVLLLSISGYLIFCKKPLLPDISMSYSQAKLGFAYNYQTSNPITKYVGDLNYLYDLLKQKSNNQQESSRITYMIQQSKISHKAMNNFKQELYILKRKMQKKISCIDQFELKELKASQV